jgi:transketolase
VKPLDQEAILRLLNQGKPIFTLEEHSLIGGFGSAVAEIVAEHNTPVSFRRFALPDEYTHVVGSQGFLRKHFGLEVDPIKNDIIAVLK